MTMQNMKKQYVTPIIDIVDIDPEFLMLTMSSEQSNAGTGNGTADDDTPDLSNKRRLRRGTWGNLWDDTGV